MALNGGAPQRGSAAAAAANLRRRRTGGTGGASGGTAGNMLQFYTDDAPGLKISPNVVLVMSIGFIAFVAVLHVVGKLYLNEGMYVFDLDEWKKQDITDVAKFGKRLVKLMDALVF
ncbi:transport protein Sec61 subunit beta-like protein [Tanacetum coccineum]